LLIVFHTCLLALPQIDEWGRSKFTLKQWFTLRAGNPHLHSKYHRHHLLLRIEVNKFSGSAVDSVLHRQTYKSVVLRGRERAPVQKPARD